MPDRAVRAGTRAARRPAMRERIILAALLAVAGLAAAGCFYEAASPRPDDFGACEGPAPAGGGVAAPTWYRDVQPIVDARCRGCHTAGGIAPFPLEDHAQIAGMRALVHDAVEARRMPPWQ